MIERVILLMLLVVSLLALGNAALIHKRSYYLESQDRVNLDRLVDNIEDLDRDRLLGLSQRLVTISQSDFGILLLLNREFRRAIVWLGVSLVSLLLYVCFLQARIFVRSRKVIIDSA